MIHRATKDRPALHRNERGVALLIVLLVTALLIALIFEFSYATRISLNNAVNFRDSQRAYFLARSGINAFIKYGNQLREYTPQGEWGVVPMISDEDTEVRFKWEDERGKININSISDAPDDWASRLFANKQISTAVVDAVKELKRERRSFGLLSELHAVMSYEDYNKVVGFLTVYSDSNININTASEDVLNSIFADRQPQMVIRILNDRKTKQISPRDVGLDTSNMGANFGKLQKDSTIFRVYSYATVGGYTKQVEAVINGSKISYWRAL